MTDVTKWPQDPGQSHSAIATEYLANLTAGSVGSVFVRAIVDGLRIADKPRRCGTRAIEQRINRLIKNPMDRTFVNVARSCLGRTLLSHDFQDFPDGKRVTIHKDVGVRIVTAGEFVWP